MSLYRYCKENGKEYLLRQWDAEKNAPLTPHGVGSTNRARVWWVCEKGHAWQTQIASRARGNSGCPICMKEKIAARVAQRRAAQENKKRNLPINSITGY